MVSIAQLCAQLRLLLRLAASDHSSVNLTACPIRCGLAARLWEETLLKRVDFGTIVAVGRLNEYLDTQSTPLEGLH